MYRILGADGKEYGPVSEEVLRQWIAQGRANARSQVKPEGGAEWISLSSLPAFASALSVPSSAPPSATAPSQATMSGLAICSLVFGVLGFCGITAVVGLVVGIIALVRINRSGGRLSGNGLAIAGICVSAFMLLICIPMMAAMTLPALARAKQKAQAINCMNNVKQLSLGVMMYASANRDQFPTAGTWCDLIQTNIGSPKVFQCPAAPATDRCDYSFNQKLGGLAMNNVKAPASTVMIFESEGGWNANGGGNELIKNPRHGPWIIVGFADGHVDQVPRARLSQLTWDP